MNEPDLRPPPSLEGPDGYRLTTSFPYLVRRVGLRVGELFDRAVASHGVDVSMYRVMAALAECDGQQLGQLSAVTTIEMSTLSRLVGTMAGKGLLTRRRPRGNGRIVEITLSAKGRKLALELMPIAARFEAAAVAGLTPQEVDRIKSQLAAAYRNLDQLERELAREPSGSKGKAGSRRKRAPRPEASTPTT